MCCEKYLIDSLNSKMWGVKRKRKKNDKGKLGIMWVILRGKKYFKILGGVNWEIEIDKINWKVKYQYSFFFN